MKIAIVAGAPSCVDAPFHSPDWKVWATGPAMCDTFPIIHRYFEVHPAWYPHISKPHFERFLQTTQAEIWAHDTSVHPHSIQYPIGAIKSRFGTEFLSSSVAWMMALAIQEGADVIGLWGVDLVTALEYRKQRPGVKHFMSLAQELGITVTAPPDCPLLMDLPAYPPNGENK